VRYLLPGYHEFGDLSNYIVVTAFFDVRVRSSSYDDRNGRTRRGASAATIAAWTVFDGFGQNKGKTQLIEELGRATFVEDQDCRLDLIIKANDLVSSMVSAALEGPNKFIASLYYEKEKAYLPVRIVNSIVCWVFCQFYSYLHKVWINSSSFKVINGSALSIGSAFTLKSSRN
jgi:hypothetical protein